MGSSGIKAACPHCQDPPRSPAHLQERPHLRNPAHHWTCPHPPDCPPANCPRDPHPHCPGCLPCPSCCSCCCPRCHCCLRCCSRCCCSCCCCSCCRPNCPCCLCCCPSHRCLSSIPSVDQ